MYKRQGNNMSRKAAFHNLGCKVNSYEMDVMLQELKNKGYEIVPFEEKADIYIVNTCTVTNIADRKSRQMLHKAKKTNPEGIVVAVGCYVPVSYTHLLVKRQVLTAFHTGSVHYAFTTFALYTAQS